MERDRTVSELFVPLAQAAVDGGTQELEALVGAVWPYAYRISCSILHDRALAEDCAQEACATLHLHVKRLRAPRAFTVWFYRIVVRQALAMQRALSATARDLEVAEQGDLDDLIARLDTVRTLMTLPAPQRICIALHVCGGMNSREIGAVLELPDSTVRFHIMRAKRSLAQSLLGARERTTPRKDSPYGAA